MKKQIRLENDKGEFLVIEEPNFEKLLDFLKVFGKTPESEKDTLIQKYFIKQSSKPFVEFSEKEKNATIEYIFEFIFKSSKMTPEELVVLLLSVAYKMSPEQILSLPASYGMFLLNGVLHYQQKPPITSPPTKWDEKDFANLLKALGVDSNK